MGVFDDIKVGLEQAIEYEKGNLKAKKTTLSVLRFMGVSVKTVEAWEAGRYQPDGAARRLLYITRENPSFPVMSGIVAR